MYFQQKLSSSRVLTITKFWSTKATIWKLVLPYCSDLDESTGKPCIWSTCCPLTGIVVKPTYIYVGERTWEPDSPWPHTISRESSKQWEWPARQSNTINMFKSFILNLGRINDFTNLYLMQFMHKKLHMHTWSMVNN